MPWLDGRQLLLNQIFENFSPQIHNGSCFSSIFRGWKAWRSRGAFTLRYIPYSLVKMLCSWRTSDADSCWMKPPNLARLTARIWSAIISAFFRRQTSCRRWAQLGCNLLVNGQTTAIVV